MHAVGNNKVISQCESSTKGYISSQIIPDDSTLIDRIEATDTIEFILVIKKETIFFMLTRLNFTRNIIV